MWIACAVRALSDLTAVNHSSILITSKSLKYLNYYALKITQIILFYLLSFVFCNVQDVRCINRYVQTNGGTETRTDTTQAMEEKLCYETASSQLF